MTFLFAAGIATIILPIAMGASVIRQLLTAQHTAIYVTGGLLMLALAVYILFGGQIHLPIPGRRAGGTPTYVATFGKEALPSISITLDFLAHFVAFAL